jgi:hypothetical protein
MEFKSAITRGGNAILPEIINVTDSDVTWKKRNKTLISSDSISIPINSISSVEIDTSLIGTTIKIKSQGQREIIASNFTASDTNEIKKLINQHKTDLVNRKAKQETYIKPSNPELEIKQFEEDKYHDIDRIPLISFSNIANEIIAELNKFIGLMKQSINVNENKKTKAYHNKLNEGLRLLDTLDLSQQQILLKDSIKNDLHNLIVQTNLFQGLSISKNNSEKLSAVFCFVKRNKWWTLFILSMIYVTIRNLIEK